MKIQNPTAKPLQEIADQLSQKYPGVTVKKPFLSGNTIFIPTENFKFLLRERKTQLIVDFVPPVLVSILSIVLSIVLLSAVLSLIYGQFVFGFGGALWLVLGFLVAKAIFKSTKKERFENFYKDVEEAIQGRQSDSRIF
ncbi:hypothetical protein DBR32_11585 [Taibaiella sp. KBW10]|uniref:hypothetical protein n=1 Tax=Taibaiella sp. KBW10 TaxID=2153357 RepID=UPI000F5B6C91|nr:hypothetical protein [Taibaiella sp. KBW10]RQO30214.1 hypothetical protein DBR32_11585 [Taibaiella sp. KBW10]